MHFNGQTFSGILEQLSFTTKFFGLKCKNHLFNEKKCFKCSFYEIEECVVTNLSTRLEKHQLIEILLKVDFFTIF